MMKSIHSLTSTCRTGIVLLVTLLLPMTACGVSGPAVEGQVIDEETNQPIAGAIVIVKWKGFVDVALVETRTVCVQVMSTVTDRNGRFVMPAWRKSLKFGPVLEFKPHSIAYKQGYEELRVQRWPDVKMKPFTSNKHERIKYLDVFSGSIACNEAGASQQNLYPLRKALYQEVKSLATTVDEVKLLKWFREWAAMDAVATDDDENISGLEGQKRIKEFLKDHLND